ncbi:CDP-diacylglycerol--serine O-phosphatidyltransferase [Roseivivax isoporae]|uniref:CDP-diacylglycerol--serine O-phosphatidyltransferase n=1 Tax=Roseivivax isoporae LMG 25204 TaxID=1449351 RepID=X7FBL3_9RHOB|nr:CDP-diacylglycerol--serine O-phosphatidyltransferase [Roseivivax isoporae]ETX30297.1 CDP-diacylglycerol--serine O-phosphatidyltransferase [Roseivivax isoporae LMG 25204]
MLDEAPRDPEGKPRRGNGAARELPLVKLLPNLVTLSAVCAGMTAIRFAWQGEFDWAVRLILLAGLLDGLDGRLARLLRSRSLIGAELDSLADFLNFAVAPALILYFWSLQEIGGAGWIAVLCYALCGLMRLARFNVDSRTTETAGPATHFTGVPSPAGGFLALLPIILSLAFDAGPFLPAGAVAAWVVFVGFLMISRLPTPSFKNVTISRGRARYVLLGTVLLAALLLIYTWATLVVLAGFYGAALLLSVRDYLRKPRGG